MPDALKKQKKTTNINIGISKKEKKKKLRGALAPISLLVISVRAFCAKLLWTIDLSRREISEKLKKNTNITFTQIFGNIHF